jgi:hypothetical protein
MEKRLSTKKRRWLRHVLLMLLLGGAAVLPQMSLLTAVVPLWLLALSRRQRQ